MTVENPVILYIIVRNDMASMNSGRKAAQACHAANQMAYCIPMSSSNMYKEWIEETGKGFGTNIILETNIEGIKTIVDKAKNLGYHANIVVDPEYKIRDGNAILSIKVETAGFVLCREKDRENTGLIWLELMS